MNIDNQFYQPADMFFPGQGGLALTYDDVSLATAYSEILPRDTSLEVKLSERLQLHIPVISSDMDTVTEARMAIAMALSGGMGLLHYNMSEEAQKRELARVKYFVHGLIQDPITVTPDLRVGDVLLKVEAKNYNFKTFPVVDPNNCLIGLLPGYALKARQQGKLVSAVMIEKSALHTILEKDLGKDPIHAADRFFQANWNADKLLVVNEKSQLRGLFTRSDIERILEEAEARGVRPCRDSQYRLACGAALAIPRDNGGKIAKDRFLTHVSELVEQGLDAAAISTAHGYTQGVGEAIALLREQFPELTLIAGNVTSAAGVEFLAEKGADVIKVGQGPGSICTTRVVAGVGIPQLTALYVCALAAKKKGVKLLADGGISKSADIVKALTLADAVICGGLLAGSPEAPGEILEIDGKLFKQYRGMGSLEAMKAGSAARYGHSTKDRFRKVAAEGIEALKEVAEPVHTVLSRLMGGVQSGMGYLGAKNLTELKEKARFVRISAAGLKESNPHDVIEIKTQRS